MSLSDSSPTAQCGGARIRQRGLGGIRTAAAPAPDGQRPTTPSAHEPLQSKAENSRKPGHAVREFLRELTDWRGVRYLQLPGRVVNRPAEGVCPKRV